MVFLFTDIAGSVDLKARLGDSEAARLISRHDELFRRTISLAASGKLVQDTGDGFLAEFATASDAVQTALRFQHAIHTEPWGDDPILVRAGVHLGEVAPTRGATGGEPKLIGLAKDIAARLMGLAMPGQILMSRASFDAARQYVREHPGIDSSEPLPELRWMAHGPYLFKGAEEPMDVFEVGAKEIAELKAPPNSEKAKRAILPGDEDLYGWRPAIGQLIPRRDNWILERRIGAGGFGEVWVATHRKVGTPRVFKFCFDAEHLRSLKRELTLFRLLREALGDRPDIAKLHDIQLDKPPFYLESEFTELGNLADWAESQGGIEQLPLTTRLDLMTGACDAVAAAYSVGVLHKDIKPSNILIYDGADGSPCPRLCDFGISILTDRSQLERHDITISGFTEVLPDGAGSSQTGTRMYAPPETLMGEPFTIQGDVYALGVLLYQMVAGDLKRPLAPGWEADVADPLLREDIASAVAGRPEDRLGSASELAQRLRTLDERHKTRRRRYATKVAVTVSAILMGLLVLVGAGYVYERGQREHIADLLRLAESSREIAESSREIAEWKTYVAGVTAADLALYQRDPFKSARAILDGLPAELHDWEWDHLSRVEALSAASAGDADAATVVRLWDDSTGQGTTLADHDKALTSVVYSPPDGRYIAYGWANGTITLWDSQTRRSGTLKGSVGEVRCLAFSPDGAILVSGARADDSLRFWDVASAFELKEREVEFEPGQSVMSVGFDPNGSRIIVGLYGDENLLQVVDTRTGEREPFGKTESHRATIFSVAFSSDGCRIASGSRSGVIRIWDAEGTFIHNLICDDGVNSVSFSPDGSKLVSGSRDGMVRLWKVETGKELLPQNAGHGSHEVYSVAFSPDGTRIASGATDKTVRIWDSSGQPRATLSGHTKAVRAVAFSPDPEGARIASASSDRTVKIWDAKTVDSILMDDDGQFVDIDFAFGPEGAQFVSSMAHRTERRWKIGVWDVSSGEITTPGTYQEYCPKLAFSPDPVRFASAHANAIRVWDDGAVLQNLPIATEVLCFSPDGKYLVLGVGATIQIWDAALEGRQIASLPGSGRIVSIAVSGTKIAAGTSDGEIRIWDWDGLTLEESTPLSGRTGAVDAIAFGPGDMLASGSGDGTVGIWDLASRTGRFLKNAHVGGVSTVAFSPDQTRLVSGGRDRMVRIWDTQYFDKLLTLRGHGAAVTRVAFSPDGSRIASASNDGTIRFWDSIALAEPNAGKDVSLILEKGASVSAGSSDAEADE